jgi:sulfur carrier protein ThiS
MRVKVHILPTWKETKSVEVEKGTTVEGLIRELHLYPDAWIAVRDQTPIPLDEVLEDGDEIKLVAVVSGG